MATLTGNKIKDTYYKLVQVDNGQLVQNGIGSPLTGSINLSGSLHVTGSQTVGGDLTVAGDVKAKHVLNMVIKTYMNSSFVELKCFHPKSNKNKVLIKLMWTNKNKSRTVTN